MRERRRVTLQQIGSGGRDRNYCQTRCHAKHGKTFNHS
jgi:hypothetical protein